MAENCINVIKAATGDALSDKEATEILGMAAEESVRLKEDGVTDGFPDRLMTAMEQRAKDEQFAKALARKHAVLTALKGNRLDIRI